MWSKKTKKARKFRMLFIRVTLCYLGILGIVILAVSLVFRGLIATYRKDILGSLQERFEQTVRSLDEEFHHASLKVEDLFTDPALKRAMLESTGNEALAAFKNLSLYRDAIPLAADLFVSFEPDSLQTPEGYVRTWVYLTEKLKLSQDTLLQVQRIMKDREDKVKITAGGEEKNRGLLLFFASPESARLEKMMVGIYISDEKLQKRLLEMTGGYDCLVAMTMQDGQIVTWAGSDSFEEIMPGEEQEQLMQAVIQGMPPASVTTIRCDSVYGGYSVYVAVSSEQLWSQQRQAQKGILIVSLIFYVLLMAVIAGVNYRFYRPISQITDLAVEHPAFSAEEKGFVNECDVIRQVLIQSRQDAKQQISNVLKLQRDMKNYALLVLCSGIIREEKRLSAILEVCDLHIIGKQYAVFGILTDQKEEFLCSILATKENLRLSTTAWMQGKRGIVLLAVLSGKDEDCAKREEIGREIREMAADYGIGLKGVFAGTVYGTLREMHMSYREVCFLMEHAGGSCSGEAVIFEQKIGRISEGYVDISRKGIELYHAMQKKDTSLVMKEVKKLLETVWDAGYDEEKQHFSRYVVIQTILGNLPESLYGDEEIHADFSRLFLVEEDCFEKEVLETVRRLLLKFMQPESPQENKVSGEQLLNYINDHYTEESLTQERVADVFDTSRKNVNRIIKETVGLTYSEYISAMRCNYAMQLLEQTDMKIQEIVEKIGYVDVSSFIRKFKNYTNVTPGEYRENKAKQG